jgi:hypothetical protein
MKAYGKVDVYIHIFLTSALAGGEWSASSRGRFNIGERVSGTDWTRGWVGPRAGQDDEEKRKFFTLLGIELRPLDRPASSQSLYRLLYPGSHMAVCSEKQECHEYIWSQKCSINSDRPRCTKNAELETNLSAHFSHLPPAISSLEASNSNTVCISRSVCSKPLFPGRDGEVQSKGKNSQHSFKKTRIWTELWNEEVLAGKRTEVPSKNH